MNFSVVVPVYNSEKTIKKCLQSIFSVNYPDYEVIVVDDGSTDESVKIASEFRCKIIKLNGNFGAGAARNRGAKEAKGKILTFTDADCLVPRDWLKKIAKHFENIDVGAVGGGYAFSKGESGIEKFAFGELAYRRKDFPMFVSAAVSNNLAVRKEIFERLGGFPEYFTGAGMEEIVFTFALSRKYKLVWDGSNGVGHYFRDNLKGYLKQQYVFAYRAAIVTIFIPSIASIEIFRHKSNFFQPLSFCLAHFFLLAAVFSFKFIFPSLLFLIFMFIANIKFFGFLRKTEFLFPFWKKSVYIYARNFVWSIGFINGALAGFSRRKKDISRVWLESYK